MVLLWGIGSDSPMAHVGHIQVRALDDEVWESKVSETAWVSEINSQRKTPKQTHVVLISPQGYNACRG